MLAGEAERGGHGKVPGKHQLPVLADPAGVPRSDGRALPLLQCYLLAEISDTDFGQ